MDGLAYKFLGSDRTSYLDDELLRFTQIIHLNDPYEFAPVILEEHMQKLLDNSIAEQANRIVSEIKTNKPNEIINQELILKLAIEQMKSADLSSEMHENFRKYTQETFNDVCVFSLSERWNSSLMWAHYSQIHKGFCIGFDRNDSLFTEGNLDEDKDRLREVVYQKNRIILKIKKNSTIDNREVFFTKNEDWKYERELRMLRFKQHSDVVLPSDIYLFKVPHRLIKEVILGMNCFGDVEKKIVHFCSQNKIDCYRAFPSYANFDMDRKIIPTPLA